MRGKVIPLLGALATVALAAASAWAQDYTATIGTTGQYMETRPAGATLVNVSSGLAGTPTTAVTLPFEFPYYGRLMSNAVICVHGMLVLGATGPIQNSNNQQYFAHGQFSTSVAFPYSTAGDVDGLVAPHWGAFFFVNEAPGGGRVYSWTTGSAPNRRYVISWENVALQGTPLITATIQCQLEETGRIVFSYSNGWGLVGAWVCGLDAIVDTRFTVPPGVVNASNLNNAYSGNDIVFTPRTVPYSGTLLYDRIVSDATGIGNSTLPNQPLGGVRLELRRDGGIVASTATTAADGSFTIAGVAVGANSTGTLHAVARNVACTVQSTAGGPSPVWNVSSGIDYAAASNLGTQTLGAGGDASGALRAALNVAHVVGTVRDWAQARTTQAIATLPVVFDGTPATTAYNPAGASPASMTVGGSASPNPDAWDDAIVAKTYGRHVLATIAALAAGSADSRFDAVSDPQNAFAEGFGYHLWSAATGDVVAVDGKSATSAEVQDLEHPAISVVKGPDVAGCVAGALHDLLDPANETADLVDGTAAPERTLALVDGFTVAPTAGTFLQAWVTAGHDAHAITRAFVANGALVDDALEPNDAQDETASAGVAGSPTRTLVLNRFDEDWFSVTLPSAAAALAADATYNQLATGATVAVEIRSAGGTLLATGAFVPVTGAVHAQAGAVAAGTYRVRVNHVSGGTVPAYSFQAYVPPSMDAAPLRDWTVGRPYDIALGIADGIAPYTLSASAGALPPGLGLNPVSLRATGTPTAAGAFAVTVQLRDSGTPANVVQRSQTVTIHEALKIALPGFVGFPVGRPFDASLPSSGGTPPLTVAVASGALPPGLAFDSNSLHVTGTPATQGTSDLVLDASDVAGSADHVATRAVVTVALDAANAPADLVAGDNACGWWLDAVQGSVISFSAKTAKGRAKRLLTGAVLAPDRSLVTTASIKAKSGSLSVSKLVCPVSGRYHVIAWSDSGDATQLTGTVKITAPKKGKAKLAAFDPTETIAIPVGVLPGGTLTLKFAGDKKLELTAKVVGMRNPAGDLVTFANFVTAAPFGGSLTATLATGGTWTVILGAQSTSGTPGKLSYSYSVAQPKDAVYVAE